MKLLLLLLCLLLSMPTATAEETFSIIATNFPAFDFARTIAADTADVRMLLPPGAESHSYEPSPQDIITIQNCNLFIYVGGESDTWIDSILSSMGDEAPPVFRLADCVTMLSSVTTQSMEELHAHEHDESCADHDHSYEENHHHDMDEHVWTSPKNVMLIVSELEKVLSEIRPEHKDAYAKSAGDYLLELQELDAAFEKIVAEGERDVIIFGDRFPFRYFAAAYGLAYDAAFPGCSEASEPSVRTVISLIDNIRTQNIPVVFYIEFSSRRTADILSEETGAKPLLFHSCHNVSTEEIEAGATYLKLMWQNTIALKEALH